MSVKAAKSGISEENQSFSFSLGSTLNHPIVIDHVAAVQSPETNEFYSPPRSKTAGNSQGVTLRAEDFSMRSGQLRENKRYSQQSSAEKHCRSRNDPNSQVPAAILPL
jgi:hypothetical protein